MSNLTTILEALIALTAGGLLITLLHARFSTHHLLDWLLGLSAGLQGAQILKVHVFTYICLLYVFFGPKVIPGRGGRSLTLLGTVVLLAASAPLGTLVNSQTLALQLVALALSGIVVATRVTPSSMANMLYGLLAACVFGAAVAVGQKFGVIPYTPFVDASGIARVRGIYSEPDWLGLFSAIGLLLIFLLPLRKYRFFQIACGVFLAAGLVLSGARVSWAAFVIVFIVMVVSLRRRERVSLQNGRAIILASLVVAFVAVLDPALTTSIVNRISSGGANHVSVLARAQQQAALRQLASLAPWHGMGLSASGHVSVSGNIIYGQSPNNVASNWILGWWVDGKYLAVPLIALLIGLALCNVRRTSGLLLGFVLLNSLYSNAVLNPILWFTVGLALAELPTAVIPLFSLAKEWPPSRPVPL